jgi:chromosome segregation ATPase
MVKGKDMEWDDDQPDVDQSAPAKIKPRRIDAAHAAVPGIEDRPSEPARVTADAAGGAAGSRISEFPDFREVSSPEAPVELPSALPFDLSLETEQLAAALEDQLSGLDERETLLATRAADLDKEWQACRTWHQQQLAMLDEREAEISRRQAEMEIFTRREENLAERFRDCESKELALDRREGDLNEREASLVAREHELRDRRQQLEREAAALSRSQQMWDQSKVRDDEALERQRQQMQAGIDEQLSQRLAELEEDKALLAEKTRALEADRQSLHRERDAWQHQRHQEHQRQAAEQRQTLDDAERRLAAVTARESALDTQQAALEQLRSEIMAAHRQVLEMRLIAEQLWAQLKGLMTPAEITQSLAQLRLKLAEQYEQEEKALAERKEELLALADKLAQQHATLKAQRMEFLAWRKSQQEEIAHQAEHLCRRVQELSEEQQRLRMPSKAA